MRYILFVATLIYATVTSAATLNERLAELTSLTGVVIGADIVSDPAPSGLTGVYVADIRYASVSGDRATDNRVRLIGTGQDADSGSWYWLSKPSVIPVVETPLMGARTVGGWGGLTNAQRAAIIEGICNQKYKYHNNGALDIREFSVSAIKGDTVKVSGSFDIGDTWERQEWYVRLPNVNDTVFTAPFNNIEFERVYTQAPTP